MMLDNLELKFVPKDWNHPRPGEHGDYDHVDVPEAPVDSPDYEYQLYVATEQIPRSPRLASIGAVVDWMVDDFGLDPSAALDFTKRLIE